jgi:hypothetical protein
MARQLIDPLTKFVYDVTDDGLVEVTDPATGQRGRFRDTGEYVSGDRVYPNRQLLGWMGRLAIRLASQG